MEFEPLRLAGLIRITPKVFADERGFFLERYHRQVFAEHGLHLDFVQDNHSRSRRGILRGMHFQLPPFAQDKLVWAIRGEIYDVAVDIRPDSPTFGQWEAAILSEANQQMLLVLKGFAHGFVVLSEMADVLYKTSHYYSKPHDRGLLWNDPDVGIDWPISDPILSEKDRHQPTLRTLERIAWE